MLRRPEPGTFEHLITTIPVPYTGMVRMGSSPSTEPYWSKRARYRFDDPSEPGPKARFGVLYVAEDLSTAFAESVIHESANFVNGSFEVSRSDFDARQPTSFQHPTRSEWVLIDLTDESLKRLGLNNDISSGDDYTIAQEWAKALHDAAPHADGLRYVSRQRNGSHCYAIFERSGLVVNSWRSLTDAEKYGLGTQFNVKPV